MSILYTILLLSIVAIVVLVVAILAIIYPRTRRRRQETSPGLVLRPPPIAAEPRAQRRSPIPREDEETVELVEAPPGEGVSETIRANLLQVLSRYQALPVEEVEARIRASKDEILKALRELEEKGLVRVDGGVLMLSERGEKLLVKLREKYAEKSRWYELLE